jgi:hypothetical protein
MIIASDIQNIIQMIDLNNCLHVACNYHYLGWVFTWKYLKQGFWGKILDIPLNFICQSVTQIPPMFSNCQNIDFNTQRMFGILHSLLVNKG